MIVTKVMYVGSRNVMLLLHARERVKNILLKLSYCHSPITHNQLDGVGGGGILGILPCIELLEFNTNQALSE